MRGAVGSCPPRLVRMTLEVARYLQHRINVCKSKAWPACRSSVDNAKANSIFQIAKMEHLKSIESISQYQ